MTVWRIRGKVIRTVLLCITVICTQVRAVLTGVGPTRFPLPELTARVTVMGNWFPLPVMVLMMGRGFNDEVS